MGWIRRLVDWLFMSKTSENLWESENREMADSLAEHAEEAPAQSANDDPTAPGSDAQLR